MNNVENLKHGFSSVGEGGQWQLWAPHARQVDLLFLDGDRRYVAPMEPQHGGWFTYFTRNVPDGQRYLFRLDGKGEFTDPASRSQPDGVHAPSAIFRQKEFTWSDDAWNGMELHNLVIYELHVGTFTPEGTFDAIVRRLPELKELGVTCLELMPVAQFPGSRGWGYDGVYPFAVQESYGGPLALQRFVDTCHAEGVAVLLDVVYNHLGPEGNYLAQFGPYFTDRYHTPWGKAWNYDDRGSDEVRAYVLENVRYWLEDFHFDGLRLDAIDTIYDNGPTHILRDIEQVAEDISTRFARPIHVIAESDLNDVRLLDSPIVGGYGLAAQWNDDFHHCVHSLLTKERRGYYDDFGQPEQLVKALEHTFVYDGIYSKFRERRHGAPTKNHPGHHFIVSIQNHDQVGNRALGDRLGTLLEPAQQRLAAGLMLLAPYLPHLFMGEEYGETRPFSYFCEFGDEGLIDSVRKGRRREFVRFGWPEHDPDPQGEATFASAKLGWSWTNDPSRSGLRQWYTDLLAARQSWHPLQDFVHRAAAWHARPNTTQADAMMPDSDSDRHQGILELLRGSAKPDDQPLLLAYFNFTSRPQALTRRGMKEAYGWSVALSSEWPRYGGARNDGSWVESFTDKAGWQLLPSEVLVFTNKAGRNL